jgi:hypothetical protein
MRAMRRRRYRRARLPGAGQDDFRRPSCSPRNGSISCLQISAYPLVEVDHLAPIDARANVADGIANRAAEVCADIPPVPVRQVLQRDLAAMPAQLTLGRPDAIDEHGLEAGAATIRRGCVIDFTRLLGEYAEIGLDYVFMQEVVVNFKKALFGWPLYIAWNLAAHTIEVRGRARALRLVASLLFWASTTGVWASFWAAVFWLLLHFTDLVCASVPSCGTN